MKNFILYVFLLISLTGYSQYITCGPDIGEIYFLGPTTNGEGLYYSTDFGETATFIDGTMDYVSIAADKTKGGIYCTTLPVALFYSESFGNTNTWVFKSSNNYLSYFIYSGITEGHVFSDCYMHSEDYGINFIIHSLNGWFGNFKSAAIDNNDQSIGYALSHKINIADTIYTFRTYDSFENVEQTHKLNYPWYEDIRLKSGFNSGEIILFNFTHNDLWISIDYLDNINYIETFNFSQNYLVDIDGGKQEGELFIMYSFANMMYQNSHIYICHSIDYGKTFEVFHPFSYGTEPVLSNFSTLVNEVHITNPVEFSNFSIGDIQEYNWDFDNDGIIDSYEETPSWTYQDTGYYSVRLTITGPDSSNTFVKENYIHVYNLTGIDNNQINETIDFNCYPNPFSQNTNLHFETSKSASLGIKVYGITGNEIGYDKSFKVAKGEHSIKLDLEFLNPGIYYISLIDNGESMGVRKLVVK